MTCQWKVRKFEAVRSHWNPGVSHSSCYPQIFGYLVLILRGFRKKGKIRNNFLLEWRWEVWRREVTREKLQWIVNYGCCCGPYWEWHWQLCCSQVQRGSMRFCSASVEDHLDVAAKSIRYLLHCLLVPVSSQPLGDLQYFLVMGCSFFFFFCGNKPSSLTLRASFGFTEGKKNHSAAAFRCFSLIKQWVSLAGVTLINHLVLSLTVQSVAFTLLTQHFSLYLLGNPATA